MFSKASCVGRLCPASLQSIDVEGFVKRVVLVPYIETEKNYYVKIFKSDCGNKKPFTCGEQSIEEQKIDPKNANVTYIFFVGHKTPEEMLIFVKLDRGSTDDFTKVTPEMNLEYSWYIQYVLGSAIEKFILKGKDIALHNILPKLEGADLVNFCKLSHLTEECTKYIEVIIKNKMGPEFLTTKIDLYDLYDILYASKFQLNESLQEAARRNNLTVVDFLFKKERAGEFVVIGAIQGNRMKLIKQFIEKGYHNWNFGLSEAAKVGNQKLVSFFIEKGADEFDEALKEAAKGGHRKIIKFFIKRFEVDPNYGLNGAAEAGHKDLVDFFIEKGADDYMGGMLSAALGGHKDLVEFFIAKINWEEADRENEMEMGMEYAAIGGHKDVVDFFIEQGAHWWDGGMRGAAEGGHKNLVDFFINKGARNWRAARQRVVDEELYDFFEMKIAEDRVHEVLEAEEERIIPRIDWL